MSEKLPVTIIITTYDPGDNSRYKLLHRTVEALVNNLKYPSVRWLITDDSRSTEQHLQMCDAMDLFLENTAHLYVQTSGKGVGFAKNNALRLAFQISPVVLLMEDDWLLKEPLDLLAHVQLLLDHEDVGMIRFGFLGGDFDAHYTDYGDFLTYWTLKHASGFYVYSGQVSLRHERFYQRIGYHAEGIQPGQEEEEMCWRYNQTANAPKILWPAKYASVLNCGPFLNIGIGTSVNAVNPEK